MTADSPDPAAAALAEIRERHTLTVMPDLDPVFSGSLFQIKSHLVRTDVPRLLAAVEKALAGAGTLDAESARFGKIAEDADPGSAVEVAALAASQAYDRSAWILREAITTELAGKEAGDGG